MRQHQESYSTVSPNFSWLGHKQGLVQRRGRGETLMKDAC